MELLQAKKSRFHFVLGNPWVINNILIMYNNPMSVFVLWLIAVRHTDTFCLFLANKDVRQVNTQLRNQFWPNRLQDSLSRFLLHLHMPMLQQKTLAPDAAKASSAQTMVCISALSLFSIFSSTESLNFLSLTTQAPSPKNRLVSRPWTHQYKCKKKRLSP